MSLALVGLGFFYVDDMSPFLLRLFILSNFTVGYSATASINYRLVILSDMYLLCTYVLMYVCRRLDKGGPSQPRISGLCMDINTGDVVSAVFNR